MAQEGKQYSENQRRIIKAVNEERLYISARIEYTEERLADDYKRLDELDEFLESIGVEEEGE